MQLPGDRFPVGRGKCFLQVLDQLLADMTEDEKRSLLTRYPRSVLLQQLDLSRLELVARETRFFEVIGVDRRISTLGHLYERELLQGKGDYLGWDYSLADLARLGVRQIRVRDDGQWDPVFPIRAGQIYRLRLDDLRDFEPRVPQQRPAGDALSLMQSPHRPSTGFDVDAAGNPHWLAQPR